MGLSQNPRRHQAQEALVEIKEKKSQLLELLHESPAIHNINRASWSLAALSLAYASIHKKSIGKSTVSEYIREQGYSFKKARRVLTSPDPNYKEKLVAITKILSSLRCDEKFFSVDEFGPFSVSMQGGRSFVPAGTNRIVPQFQRGKGRLILTGALELSTNQLTHFYSDKKNTVEMIRLLGILIKQYSSESCIYLSWDAASWHISSKLTDHVAKLNAVAKTENLPVVKLAPLPSSAQFLNVIESVFSGMSRAVIHNSDYATVEDCKIALDRYIEERNEHYKKNPQRAGDKIWGKEIVIPKFNPGNNCKDPKWR